MKYIRTKYDEILELQKTSKCIYVIRNKNIDSKNCYVSYLWDDWKNYYLIDYQNCVLFSYNSAQCFISDLMKENLNYQDLIIEISPYYQNCKQANTIEELCDTFVFEMGLEHNICQLTFEQVRDNILNCELYSMSKLYGAIWTDKGLIYVAKMNEKGDLELL
jgi:hypothetical protein